MRIGILIQARYGSERLPGKVLRTINGMSLLTHIWRRMLACKEADAVMVAWGGDPKPMNADPSPVYFTHVPGLPEKKLKERLCAVTQQLQLDAFVRITADCLFHDPTFIDSMIAYYRAAYPKIKGLTTWHPFRTISEGLDAELYSLELMQEVMTQDKYGSETWTVEIADQLEHFKPMGGKIVGSMAKLSIDDADDAARTDKMLKILGNDEWGYEKTIEAYKAVMQ